MISKKCRSSMGCFPIYLWYSPSSRASQKALQRLYAFLYAPLETLFVAFREDVPDPAFHIICLGVAEPDRDCRPLQVEPEHRAPAYFAFRHIRHSFPMARLLPKPHHQGTGCHDLPGFPLILAFPTCLPVPCQPDETPSATSRPRLMPDGPASRSRTRPSARCQNYSAESAGNIQTWFRLISARILNQGDIPIPLIVSFQ